jgi:photosystem II stability/assembly factor-like uncharacterized protein
MKKYYSILILFFVFILTSCQQNPTKPEKVVKTEVYIGYAVGDSGKVFKSTNGGVNWFSAQTGITSKLNSVYTFTDAIAIAVGDNGIIIKTTNGGNSWNIQQSGTTVNLTKITFNTQTNQCWIVGEQGVVLNSSSYY